nr:LytTR family DNA-binding domain-containing protein [uncultured Dyadobacter sp.]
MTRCLLVDDEPLARQILETYIRQNDALELAHSCSNAFEAFEVLHSGQVDLLFLDIELPALTGIDFIRQLKNPPPIIFTTAYQQYAVESYEVEAVDFLLKPITYERFQQGVSRFFKRLPEKAPPPAHTYFKVNGELIRLSHADILYAQSLKDYLFIQTMKGHYITHLTMKALSELLPATQFRRVHRSFLINKSQVTAIGRHEIKLGKYTVPIGDSFRPDML